MTAGINLDLGNFKTIEVDAAAGTMTIGGAVRASEVASALQSAGMEISMSLPHYFFPRLSFVTSMTLLVLEVLTSGYLLQPSHNARVLASPGPP